MSEMKTCKICGEEKELNNKNFIWKDTCWLGKCRNCDNELQRKKRAEKKGINYIPKTNKSIKTQNTSLEKEIYTMFDKAEIEALKEIAKNYPDIKKILNKDIQRPDNIIDKVINTKEERTKQTYTITNNLINEIDKYSKKHRISKSDCINIALLKLFKE